VLSFVEKYGWNVYSQNNEDGLLLECLERINPLLKMSVEFGGADGWYCSNTAILRSEGWEVIMCDLTATPPLVRAMEITPDNVNDLPACSVLSIDIDGNDYEVWKAYEGKPDIIIIEINSSLPPMKAHFSPEQGSSYITMLMLGLEKGYFLVCHTGNLVFVLNKHRALFPDIVGDGLTNWEEYFNKSWL
jgi:hypothetical protein